MNSFVEYDNPLKQDMMVLLLRGVLCRMEASLILLLDDQDNREGSVLTATMNLTELVPFLNYAVIYYIYHYC